MTTPSIHRFLAILSTTILISSCTEANAAEVLFKDSFQYPASAKTLADINSGARDRQQGTLAPAAYSSNGDAWQCKTNFGASGSCGVRMYPSLNRVPLVLSPAWKLSSEPGKYSLVLQIRPRTWSNSEEPEKILIAIGAAELGGKAGVSPDLAGAVVVEMHFDQANRNRFLSVLFDQSQVSAPIDLSTLSDIADLHDVQIRWKQAVSGRLESLSIDLDGIEVFKLPDATFVLQGRSVLFGGQMGPTQKLTRQAAADMSVKSIQYAQEKP